jgi:hypothetical protein
MVCICTSAGELSIDFLFLNFPALVSRAKTPHVTPSGSAFEKFFDGGVAHDSIRLREARLAADHHCAAPTKKRRAAICNTFPQTVSLTHRQ